MNHISCYEKTWKLDELWVEFWGMAVVLHKAINREWNTCDAVRSVRMMGTSVAAGVVGTVGNYMQWVLCTLMPEVCNSEPLGALWLKSVGFFKKLLSYFDECISELMWDHWLFCGIKFESNSRGKNICFYNLFLFVIRLWLSTFTLSMLACQLFNPGATWPGSLFIRSMVGSLMTSHSQALRFRSLPEHCFSNDTQLWGWCSAGALTQRVG